jgi:hypothetical protein
MRRRALLFAIALLTSAPLFAQATWQPTPPPLVTAQNESWYLAADAIEWAGAFYSPAGAPRYFDPYQMVKAGSYRGIPLYTDATRGPYDVVYVPIGSDLMQPYMRPRTGELSGTASTLSPEFPVGVATEGNPTAQLAERQTAGPPAMARSYDVMPGAELTPLEGQTAAPPETTGTMGRSLAMPGRIDSVLPPRGVNGIWVNYDGGRWFLSGKATDFDPAHFTKIGQYYGFPVYERNGDSSAIYIPSTPGLLARYAQR